MLTKAILLCQDHLPWLEIVWLWMDTRVYAGHFLSSQNPSESIKEAPHRELACPIPHFSF